MSSSTSRKGRKLVQRSVGQQPHKLQRRSIYMASISICSPQREPVVLDVPLALSAASRSKADAEATFAMAAIAAYRTRATKIRVISIARVRRHLTSRYALVDCSAARVQEERQGCWPASSATWRLHHLRVVARGTVQRTVAFARQQGAVGRTGHRARIALSFSYSSSRTRYWPISVC